MMTGTRKQKAVMAAGLLLAATAAEVARAAKVTSIDFVSSGANSELDIRSDGPITFEKSENAADKQVIVDLKDTSLSKNASRKMDTSSFDSKVVLVSPYAVNDGKDARVVLQLRDMASANVTQSGNTIKVVVANKGGETTPEVGSTTEAAAAATDMPASPTAEVGTTTAAPPTSAAPTNVAANGAKDKLAQFIDDRETGHFSGKPITLKVRDADIMDVFRLISDTSGFNIIVGDDVKGKITLSLEEVPWDQALDVILRTQKLGAERNNNVLRIVTLANLTAEKQAELAAKQATEANAPRITRVFPVNYAKIDELVSILNKFAGNPNLPLAVSPPGGAAVAHASQVQAVVQTDSRTNSIVVRDTAENVERMHKLIQILDTQTPQVLIEGKVIEASEEFTKSLGGQIGFGKGTGQGQYFTSFAGANPIDPLFSINGGNSVLPGGGKDISTGSSNGGSFGLSPTLAFLPGNTRLNALLNLSEIERSVHVVASPKAVVMDKEKATIVQSTPVLMLSIAQTANGPVSLPSVQQANLSLDVTPTVTNEGSVLMQLSLSRDIPQNLGLVNGQPSSAVASRNITTRVLVDSGSTLVMGGVYTSDQSNNSSGFPVLRKIPILGSLFGSESSDTTRTELFFFITPRILNLKEAGISG